MNEQQSQREYTVSEIASMFADNNMLSSRIKELERELAAAKAERIQAVFHMSRLAKENATFHAAEKFPESNRVGAMKAYADTMTAELERENAELKAQQNTLVSLIWETRWVSEDHDYQNLVGIAAEIRSGNLGGLNKETAERDQLSLQVMRLREALEVCYDALCRIGQITDETRTGWAILAADKALSETPAQSAKEVLEPLRASFHWITKAPDLGKATKLASNALELIEKLK